MPKPRLPWFKVWCGATRHEKVVTLDDRTFRAWIELLDAGSIQQVRGHFSSYTTAAAIIRRPVAMVRKLGQAGLIDEDENGIWLHDWTDWQRWLPDGDNKIDITIDSRITPESHAIDSRLAPESPVNDTRITLAHAKKKKRDRDVDINTPSLHALPEERARKNGTENSFESMGALIAEHERRLTKEQGAGGRGDN